MGRRILSSRPEPAPAVVHHDYIIDYSVMCGGWCVYDQVGRGDYTVVAGPFDYVGEADYAREELMNEQ